MIDKSLSLSVSDFHWSVNDIILKFRIVHLILCFSLKQVSETEKKNNKNCWKYNSIHFYWVSREECIIEIREIIKKIKKTKSNKKLYILLEKSSLNEVLNSTRLKNHQYTYMINASSQDCLLTWNTVKSLQIFN